MNSKKMTGLPLLLVVLTLVGGTFGCGKTEEKAATEETKKVEKRPVATAPSKDQTLQNCLREHEGADRKYCECFADQMHDRLDQDSTPQQRGQAAVSAAMACKEHRK